MARDQGASRGSHSAQRLVTPPPIHTRGTHAPSSRENGLSPQLWPCRGRAGFLQTRLQGETFIPEIRDDPSAIEPIRRLGCQPDGGGLHDFGPDELFLAIGGG